MWFITSIYLAKPENSESPAKAETKRTFGYYSKLEDAIETIKANRCDMHECLYNYLVLEKIGEGIHPVPTEEDWFMWENKWMPCMKPNELVGIVNWAIG